MNVKLNSLFLSLILSLALGFSSAREGSLDTLKIGVFEPVVINDYERDVLINIVSMIEHSGIPYKLFNENYTYEELLEYEVLVFSGITSFNVSQEIAISKAIDAGVSVIWIGGDISNLFTLQTALGIEYLTSDQAQDLQILKIRFNDTEIPVNWDEELTLVNTVEARTIGHFIDDGGAVNYSAVTYYRRDPASGHAYFFAFPVADYWNTLPGTAENWIRPLQLYKALLKTSEGMLTLSPYPDNLRALLLVRVEDVSPLNDQLEWLSRAQALKTYADSIGLPLNVAVIPVYAVPSPYTYPGVFDADSDGDIDQFDRAWLENFLATTDIFADAHDVPVAVNELGITRWAPGATDFMDDQMDLFEQYGMNYALWLWEPSWEPYVEESGEFNFRLGPDPNNSNDVVSNDLSDVIVKYWRYNEIYPSNPPIDKMALWNLSSGPHLRGANIFQRQVYPELDGLDFMGPYSVGPPYTQEDLDRLAELGSNLVVISHPGLYTETPPYTLDEDIQDNLDNLLDMIAKADMFAVISFRTGPGRSEFTFIRNEVGTWFDESYFNDQVWKEQAAQDGWVEMWRYTAERYSDNPVIVGYNLMVEPNANEIWLEIWNAEDFYPNHAGTLYDWNQLYPRITDAIRQVDASTPILIGAMESGAVQWLPYLQPTGDQRTVYLVHQYEPFVYTNQVAEIFRPLHQSPRLLSFLLDITSDGTIIQHGFTHQYGNAEDDYTGVDSEFYDEDSGLWLRFEDQVDRIRKGKVTIEETLPIKVTAFEAPHYKSNQDTIKAASELGLRFFSEASNRPVIDRFGEWGYLEQYEAISIPETLSYIPNSPTAEFYINSLESAKLLYEMNGVQLFFVHLFNDQQLRITEDLIAEIKKQDLLWTPNIEEAGKFWSERTKAYDSMKIMRGDSSHKLTVTLGNVSVEGLTFNYLGEKEIMSVEINGETYNNIGKNYIILDKLVSEYNIITIELEKQPTSNVKFFYTPLTIVTGFCLIFAIIIILKYWRSKT